MRPTINSIKPKGDKKPAKALPLQPDAQNPNIIKPMPVKTKTGDIFLRPRHYLIMIHIRYQYKNIGLRPVVSCLMP